jgi:DNA-binding NarL/FixJ family response regulator
MGCGLGRVLGEDQSIRVLASGLEDDALEDAVARQLPRVAILGEAAEYALLVRLLSRRRAPGVLVLLQEQPLLWGALLAAGVGCLARSVSPEDLIAAVHLAAMARRTSLSVDRRWVERTVSGETEHLTEREIEVFKYLSKSLTYAQIALEMKLAETTVKTHSAQIRRKLGVKSKRELIGMAISSRLGIETD